MRLRRRLFLNDAVMVSGPLVLYSAMREDLLSEGRLVVYRSAFLLCE